MRENKKKIVVYIHGKGGSASEAKHYKSLFESSEVIGFDYKSQTPWEAKEEFLQYFDKLLEKGCSLEIIANSIGAYFAMNALSQKNIEKAYFISPVVDMEKLIYGMMACAGVSEQDLCKNGEIPTDFGETLSWKYLCYVRKNPIDWRIPTHIFYGENDDLTPLETISDFARKTNATLSVMKGGEHWFHTKEQMDFIDERIKFFYKQKYIKCVFLSSLRFLNF